MGNGPSHKIPLGLIVSMVVVLLGIAAGGAWFYRAQEKAVRQQAEDQFTAVARLKAEQIITWRAERFSDAAGLVMNPLFDETVSRYLGNADSDAGQKLLDIFQRFAGQNQYRDVLLVDPDGVTRLNLSGRVDMRLEYADAFETAMRDRKTVVTNLHVEPQYAETHLSIVCPIPSRDDESAPPLGAVVLVCDAAHWLYPMIQAWPTPSETAETLLVRRDGDAVLFLNDLRFEPNAALKLRIPLTHTDVPAVMAVQGQRGLVEGKDYRGVDVVAFIQAIPDSPWLMVAKEDTVEVFATWYQSALYILALLLGMIGLVLAFGLIAWQRAKRRHFHALYHAEAALRATMERHSVMLHALGDGVIATDGQGRVELLSPVAEGLTGWSQAEALSRPLEEVFHIVSESTREVVENPVEKVLREGKVVGLANHTLLITRDGREVPIADSAAPIRDIKGGTNGVVLVFRDQTDERWAYRMMQVRLNLMEYATAHSVPEILTNILDELGSIVSSPIGFFHVVDADQSTLLQQQWSTQTIKEFCKAEGEHAPIEVAGVWADCVRERCPLILNDYAGSANRKGLPQGHAEMVRILTVPVMRQGIVVAVVGLGNKPVDYTEKDVESVGYLADVAWQIVEHKQADGERERLKAAIEQASDSVAITDTDGNIQYVNPAFERASGYAKAELLGQNPRAIKSGHHDDAFYSNLWATITRGETWQGRIVNKRKDGKLYTEDATISPVLDSTGAIIKYLAVKRDITQQLRLESQVLQTQKMDSVGRLAGGVAHDFNNMLGVIMGHTELALMNADANSGVAAELQEIRKAGERSVALTRQLLAFARKQTIAPKVLNLNEALESMLKMLQRLIGEDIHLAWNPGQDVWPVKMDPAQLDQILVNLCINARDAITGVGKVNIETQRITVGEACSDSHIGFSTGDFIMLAVSDNGHGMDKDTLSKIYEPFFTTKDAGHGTGLGLATVYGIVKQNEGFINVYSEPDRGTTFKIYLPRHAGDEEPVEVFGTHETPPGHGQLVLLVEDEPGILRLGKKMLERLGYNALAASSPDEALRLAAQHPEEIALLVSDVIMPVMNGRDLADQLRVLCPAVKVLFMSGYTANVIAHQGVLDEGVHFIQKPFTMHGLGEKVSEALNGV